MKHEDVVVTVKKGGLLNIVMLWHIICCLFAIHELMFSTPFEFVGL